MVFEYDSTNIDLALEVVSVVMSSFSLIGNIGVLLTSTIFYQEMVKRKTFMQLLTAISAANLITSVAGTFGFPTNGDTCSVQGFLWGFGSRLTWFFATTISFQLYYYMKHARFLLTFQKVVGICVLLDLILSCVPIMMKTYYGLPAISRGTSYCKLEEMSLHHSGTNWEKCPNCKLAMFISLFIPGIVCLISMTVFSWLLRRMMKADADLLDEEGRHHNSRIMRQVVVYPLGIVVFWTPILLYFLVQFSKKSSIEGSTLTEHVLFNSFNALVAAEGAYISFAFFTNSNEARTRWYRLLWSGGSASGDNASSNGASDEDRSTEQSLYSEHDFLPDEVMEETERSMRKASQVTLDARGGRKRVTSTGSVVISPVSSDSGTGRGASFHFAGGAQQPNEYL
jgi:hypothetical protein